ncbi:MAG TPA: hypothetical protein DDZ57_07625 [Porphyromonadaceae bacterium]|jgi:riboflavin transporter FmnP|nr:hypothetical protein [Porphyromonadaceae bacterium]
MLPFLIKRIDVYNFIKKNKVYFVAILLIIAFILIGKFISAIDFRELKRSLYEMPDMIGGVVLASTSGYVTSIARQLLWLGTAGVFYFILPKETQIKLSK